MPAITSSKFEKHCTALLRSALHWNKPNCSHLSTTCTSQRYASLYRRLLHYTASHSTTLQCTSLRYTSLHRTLPHRTALQCFYILVSHLTSCLTVVYSTHYHPSEISLNDFSLSYELPSKVAAAAAHLTLQVGPPSTKLHDLDPFTFHFASHTTSVPAQPRLLHRASVI
jgi:hypothetical protein